MDNEKSKILSIIIHKLTVKKKITEEGVQAIEILVLLAHILGKINWYVKNVVDL